MHGRACKQYTFWSCNKQYTFRSCNKQYTFRSCNKQYTFQSYWAIQAAHLLSATVRVYSVVAPCRLPDLTSLALLGSVSGQPGLSRGPLPGYKRVSKWRLQLQDLIPFLLLSQRLCTTLHTSASLGCYLLFTRMPDCPLAPLGQV